MYERWKLTRSDKKISRKNTPGSCVVGAQIFAPGSMEKKIFDAIEREGDDERSESRGKDSTERNEYRRRNKWEGEREKDEIAKRLRLRERVVL
jgi:hypothetical protein